MVKRIKVWDLPTRLFHWSLLLAVFYAWFSVIILEDMQQHFYAGYVVFTLLLFRLVWGCVGSPYARFRSFVYSFKEIRRYVSGLLSGQSARYMGHNPIGALSALAIILVLGAQVTFGLFSTDDYFFGPLSGLVSDGVRQRLTALHLDNITVIYVLLGLHVLAIVFYRVVKDEALTKPMITGYKKADAQAIDAHRIDARSERASNILALVLLIACAVFVYWLVNAYALPISEYDYY